MERGLTRLRRVALPPGSGSALLAACLVATFVACGPVEVVAPLPAHSLGPDIDSNAFKGVLQVKQSCVYLAQDGLDLNILWPAGYTLRGSPPVVIRDDGTAIATIGDSVVIGGLPTTGQIAPPGCPARRGILLGLIASVDGVEVSPAVTQSRPPEPPMTERPKPR